jgi:hypothetical protein
MMEGIPSNEPSKVDLKYRFEFTDNPSGNSRQLSNGYDPTYGCGYESSSTVKWSDLYKNPSLRMKPLSFIISSVIQ